MTFENQQVLPAFRTMKQLEKFLDTDFQYGVLLDSQLGQLKGIMNALKSANKKAILHVDLINGLKADEYAVDYLCHELHPAGIVSTKSSVVLKAKKRGVYAIQRAFLLDSGSLEKTYRMTQKLQPDFIELIPGLIPSLIKEVRETTKTPVFVGGLIRTEADIERALEAGASAVTTSNPELWKTYG